MALRTNRILLGTDVTPLPRRRPWKLARETVTLDHLSGGRLVLGVGLGDTNDPGFAQMGEATAAGQRARMLDEALDVLVGLWSGQPFQYQGEYYRLEEVVFLPRLKSLAEVGATWWIEWIPPASLDVMRACIQRGPLRVD
jgi:alkanesulfonate monooxygenase SsuD/methylene tetrahydromethanopterin reductase-like flavin-dependent oxidoreductase (luciferase family)